jgi:spermidine synthase
LPFLFPEHLRATTEIFVLLFRVASPYMCTQPCYFGGPFALNAASDGEGLFGVSIGTLKSRMAKRAIETRYYTPAGHRAAFALPGYVEKVVAEAVQIRSRGSMRQKTRR